MQGAVLMADPSADVYGADLQLLETVAALREREHLNCATSVGSFTSRSLMT